MHRLESAGMTALSLPRPRRIRPFAVLAASIALIAASQLVNLVRPTSVSTPDVAPRVAGPISPPEAPIAGTPGTLDRIDKAISAWTVNVTANEADFLSAATLGQLYEARARLSGDVTDYVRAEQAASRSLAIEPRQLDVQALHSRILLATHDFRGALAGAEAVDRAAPDQPAVLAIIGDAQLELGELEAAADAYARIEAFAPGPAVSARLARVAFLRGTTDEAVRLAEQSYTSAVADGQTGPGLSWYAYLAGTLSRAAGAPEAAATWFDRALEAWPGSHLALAGSARVAASLGDVDAAIAAYRAAIGISPQPDALAALGDLLELQGDVDGAEREYATVGAIAQVQGGGDGLVFNRQLVLFNVDHGRDLADALSLAEAELAVRKDVYGYDAYAWALLANGRAAEADMAMATALAFGTRDAALLYHAGEIARALGDSERASSLLQEAIAIRGALDPRSAGRAAAALEALR
jgi:tetratricopeptide (TPR) repeat protein